MDILVYRDGSYWIGVKTRPDEIERIVKHDWKIVNINKKTIEFLLRLLGDKLEHIPGQFYRII